MRVHFMRLAVQDLRGSTIRKRALRLGRPELWALYMELLWALHEAGGTLSSDPQALADELEFWTPEQIADMLPLLAPAPGKRGGIVVDGGSLRCQRVNDSLDEEAAFRAAQAERGRSGGRASAKRTLSECSKALKPPSPSPLPLPTPETETEPRAREVAEPTAPPRPSPRELYTRELWAEWVKRRGVTEHPPWSSAEFDLACRWHDQGVPLRIVLRGIEDCRGAQNGGQRSLLYYRPAVEEAIKRHKKGPPL